MKNNLYLLVLLPLLILVWPTAPLLSQELSKEKVVIILKDGTEYTGTILKKKDEVTVLQQSNGIKVEIPNKQIRSINPYRKKQFQKTMPNSNGYLFGNSAQMQKKGSLQYRNAYFVLNGLNYGLNDFITIGGGVEIFSTLSSDVPALGYFRIKAGAQIQENFHLSKGVVFFGSSELNEPIHLAFTNATFGQTEHHISAGIGYNLNELGGVALNLSYLNRFSKKTAVISENWILSSDGDLNVISYGFRFFGDNFSFDAALFNNTVIMNYWPIGFPFLGFQIQLR